MKKFTAILLAMILAFSVILTASAQTDSAEKLQFDADGNFRIMQISDIQDGTLLTPATKTYLKEWRDDIYT